MEKVKRTTLKEAVGDKEYAEIVEKALRNKFFKTAHALIRKEAVLDGSGACDGDDDCDVGEVYAEVIRGCEPFLTREIARIFKTDKSELTIPLNDTVEASDLSCNQDTGDTYTIGGETTTCLKILLDKEPGVRPLWTRSYLEDASWDVMARQVKGAGRGIEEYIMDLILAEYLWDTISTGQVSCYTSTATGPAITWAEFTAAVAAMESIDGHPNVLIVAPDLYGALLSLQQFTDASWIGTDEAMKSGIIVTTFGLKVIRSSRMPDGIGFLIDNDKAGALAIRREITMEPYERPEINQYGFVASARIGFDIMHSCGLWQLSAC